ncbi:hypothetical protein NDU88_000447 [Pleurodeles waltl]|uniref:Uncharacterized protein n=1 Tax=Pleurodeles waltl TaxID=8319 RepID=A0AAV7S9M8_PLEWA|nr:hypothetical protein NDU88_000447 [Pleurodeles waltl]
MDGRLDHQPSRLDGAEERISGLKDGAVTTTKHLEKMEHLLKSIVANKKYLEKRSGSNNICIMGVAESTDMGHPDMFLECLLTKLFD